MRPMLQPRRQHRIPAPRKPHNDVTARENAVVFRRLHREAASLIKQIKNTASECSSYQCFRHGIFIYRLSYQSNHMLVDIIRFSDLIYICNNISPPALLHRSAIPPDRNNRKTVMKRPVSGNARKHYHYYYYHHSLSTFPCRYE